MGCFTLTKHMIWKGRLTSCWAGKITLRTQESKIRKGWCWIWSELQFLLRITSGLQIGLQFLSKVHNKFWKVSFVSKLYLLPTAFCPPNRSQRCFNMLMSDAAVLWQFFWKQAQLRCLHDVRTAPAAACCLYQSSKVLISVHKQTAKLRSPSLGKCVDLRQRATAPHRS